MSVPGSVVSNIPPEEIAKEAADILGTSRALYGPKTAIESYRGAMNAPENKLQQEAYDMARERARGQTWSPYLNQASQLSQTAKQTYPEQYKRYLNPYEDAVARTISGDISRNFTENVLPALESNFIRRGQHGSSKHRKLVQKAHRDMQSELMARLAQVRAHGYEAGASQFESEQRRLAALSNLIAGLGTQHQASTIADISTLQDVGGARHQLEQNNVDRQREEWLRQQAIPMDRLAMRHALLHGLPFATSQTAGYGTPPQPRMNMAGKLGSLATTLLGMNRKGIFG